MLAVKEVLLVEERSRGKVPEKKKELVGHVTEVEGPWPSLLIISPYSRYRIFHKYVSLLISITRSVANVAAYHISMFFQFLYFDPWP